MDENISSFHEFGSLSTWDYQLFVPEISGLTTEALYPNFGKRRDFKNDFVEMRYKGNKYTIDRIAYSVFQNILKTVNGTYSQYSVDLFDDVDQIRKMKLLSYSKTEMSKISALDFENLELKDVLEHEFNGRQMSTSAFLCNFIFTYQGDDKKNVVYHLDSVLTDKYLYFFSSIYGADIVEKGMSKFDIRRTIINNLLREQNKPIKRLINIGIQDIGSFKLSDFLFDV